MRLSDRVPLWWPWRRLLSGAVVVGGTGLLAACGAGSSIPGLSNDLFSSQPQQPSAAGQAPETYFQRTAVCPTTEIRTGAESIRVYARGGDGDPEQVRYQASISESARECRNGGQGVIVRVGVKGRVVAGPKGGAETVKVAVRVAVLEDSTEVVYSQLHQVSVTLTPPAFGETFALVDENVTFPIKPGKTYRAYVGFDNP